MTYNHSGRLTLIAIVLVVALIMIFPNPAALLRSDVPLGEKINLKPGIDMVGGTSLTYEIKQPEGGYQGEVTLAESVASALKKRVDPEGVRNIVWRPQGNTQLEIQLPRSTDNADARKLRDAYIAAQQKLEADTVRQAEVVRVIEQLKGDERAPRLNELAANNPARQDLFARLVAAYDALQAARERRDADAEAVAAIEYDNLKGQIDATNVGVARLETILSLPAAERETQLAALKVGMPANRLATVDEFVAAYDAFAKVKDTIDDAASLKRLLRGSGMLAFYILADENEPGFGTMVQRLQTQGPDVQAGDTMRWFEIDQPDDFEGYPKFEYGGKWYALAWITPERSMVNPPGQRLWSLEKATPENDPNGGRAVGFQFDPMGATLFGQLTGGNLRRPLAVTLDQKIISAANINSQITRNGIITRGDGYTNAEFAYLLNTLNAGSLPATLADEPIREQTVGPQLGADNLKRGLAACVVGLFVVGLFLCGYYYLAGLVAAIAVLLNVFLILATMAALDATFTLPGIAGIVLTIGAAVDANVLIFERLREEQQRGIGIKAALRNAYDRAASAIIDSNATTLITAAVLVWLGTEEVKGFGVTLLIGLIWSLFTSLYVTRTVLELLVDKFGVTKFGSVPLSVPWWDRALKPDIDWMSKAWMFMAFSALFIVLGVTGFMVKLYQGQLLDVEFTKGTSVQFELKREMNIERVRERIAATNLPSPSVVAVGTEGTTYEVVTPEENSTLVTHAILAAMADGDANESLLDVETPSEYAGFDDTFDAALNNVILPIGDEPITVQGFTPAQLADYRNGAAIVLKDLNPRRTPTEIADRIRRQQLQPQAGTPVPSHIDFVVESPAGPNDVTDLAVILVAPGSVPYDKDAQQWAAQLAAPMWKLIGDAINTPAPLQSVRSIDPSVASDTKELAMAALVLSVLVIMVYVWLRFGNLKYGTATVLAMTHDTLLAVGAVGIAHYMVQWTPWLASALLVEPFRMNLTMVAGILTVMSYSMIDTIVVFDRIRENRGKLGHVSRRVVNNSINQTLSRTLLTVGTTVATLLGMYIFGGPGIHGFTFVLLIGILVGTYSSIAIAAPFLLIGGDRETAGAGNNPAVGQLQRA
ncbi:MAG TPA: protein translocase subunit SecD [Tepidisphaeraceae bacterium]|jgi:SecD/SecF fusion protein|nr:protein translocase subunit SecD [Tepidisphaeraceae bacterium]